MSGMDYIDLYLTEFCHQQNVLTLHTSEKSGIQMYTKLD